MLQGGDSPLPPHPLGAGHAWCGGGCMGRPPRCSAWLLLSEVMAGPASGSAGGRTSILWLPSPDHLPWNLTGPQNPLLHLIFQSGAFRCVEHMISVFQKTSAHWLFGLFENLPGVVTAAAAALQEPLKSRPSCTFLNADCACLKLCLHFWVVSS